MRLPLGPAGHGRRPASRNRNRRAATERSGAEGLPPQGVALHCGKSVWSRRRGTSGGGRRVAPPGGGRARGVLRGRSSNAAEGGRPATTFGRGVESGQVARLRSGPQRPGDADDQRVRPRLSGPARPRRTTPNWTRNSTRVRSMTCGPARPRARRGLAGVAGARGAWPAWSGARAPTRC